jgi:hypothetical protein
MKSRGFIAIVAATILGSVLLYGAAFWLALSRSLWPYDWIPAVYGIKDDLAAKSGPPRWFILGGSSAWFGFDSKQLQHACGARVVNLGIHAELPISFQLWQAERHARSGDVVLLADELVSYYRDKPTTFAAEQIAMMAPEYYFHASWRRRMQLLQAVPPSRVGTGLFVWMWSVLVEDNHSLDRPTRREAMSNLIARWKGSYAGAVPAYYNYLELDENGDFARPREPMAHHPDDYGLKADAELNPETENELRGFAQRMAARGVKCYFTWPPFEDQSGFVMTDSSVQRNLSALAPKLASAGWVEISTPEQSLLSSSLFFDTAYHLTREGASIRTARLVTALRRLSSPLESIAPP